MLWVLLRNCFIMSAQRVMFEPEGVDFCAPNGDRLWTHLICKPIKVVQQAFAPATIYYWSRYTSYLRSLVHGNCPGRWLLCEGATRWSWSINHAKRNTLIEARLLASRYDNLRALAPMQLLPGNLANWLSVKRGAHLWPARVGARARSHTFLAPSCAFLFDFVVIFRLKHATQTMNGDYFAIVNFITNSIIIIGCLFARQLIVATHRRT